MATPNSLSHDDSSDGDVFELVQDFARIGSLLIVMGIWTIIGFFFWIPIIFFGIAHYSALLLYATITAKNPTSLDTYLSRAARFYLQGFRTLWQAICTKAMPHSAASALTIGFGTIFWYTLLTMFFWTVVFVIVILVLWWRGTVSPLTWFDL